MNNNAYSLKKIFFWLLWWGMILAISSYFLFNSFKTHWPKIVSELYAPALLSPNTPIATPTASTNNTASLSAAMINDLVHAIMLANKQQASESAAATTATKLKTPEQNQTQTLTKTASGSANPKKKNL